MGHWDRLGTARALPGSPPSASRCGRNNVFPIAMSPAPLQSKPPAAAHLQHISSCYRIRGSHAAPRCGMATARHGTAGRDRQLPLPGTNLGLTLPAAPQGSPCLCRVVSIPPPCQAPGTPLARATPPKIAHPTGGRLRWPGAWLPASPGSAVGQPRSPDRCHPHHAQCWGATTGTPRLAPGLHPDLGAECYAGSWGSPTPPCGARLSPHRSPAPVSSCTLSGGTRAPTLANPPSSPPKSTGAQGTSAQQMGKGCERDEIRQIRTKMKEGRAGCGMGRGGAPQPLAGAAATGSYRQPKGLPASQQIYLSLTITARYCSSGHVLAAASSSGLFYLSPPSSPGRSSSHPASSPPPAPLLPGLICAHPKGPWSSPAPRVPSATRP